MSIKVALEHRTSYSFDRPVLLFPQVVRLDAYSLRIDPDGHFVNWQQDAEGNCLARLVFPNPVRRLAITVRPIADLKVINPCESFIEDCRT
ncbi:hypothetical protein KXD96_13525 [Mycobacterium sp. SMC-2]|nr:hypothetical protein KXD96_13525 [Mycobacterium sp. SMC-2]